MIPARSQDISAVQPAPINASKAAQPKTTANAGPFLILLTQVMPKAVRARAQIPNTSTAEPSAHHGPAWARRGTG